MSSGTINAITLRLPSELMDEIRLYRALTGTPGNELIVRLVRDFFAGTGRDELLRSMTDRAREQYGVALEELAKR